MSGRGDRAPGDAAPGDHDFGPLGGLPDQVHEYTRRRDRAAATEGDRLMRNATGGRDPREASRIAAALGVLRRLVGGR